MKVLYVENILHVNNFLPKKLEPYLAFLWEKLRVHYVNKKSQAVSTFMLMIFNVMQPKLDFNTLLFVVFTFMIPLVKYQILCQLFSIWSIILQVCEKTF